MKTLEILYMSGESNEIQSHKKWYYLKVDSYFRLGICKLVGKYMRNQDKSKRKY